MTADELLAKEVRKKLRILGYRLTTAQRDNDEPAVRRLEKSIALATSKLLCAHQIETQSMRVNGRLRTHHRCTICKLSSFE